MSLELQFFAQNAHFAINLLAALVMLMIAWLHFDAWLNKKGMPGLSKWVGFLLLAISFSAHAVTVEQVFIAKTIFGTSTANLAIITHFTGLLVIIYSQLIDPLQPVPKTEGLKLHPKNAFILTGAKVVGLFKLLAPVVSLAVAILFARRATTGLERHLKPVAWGFIFLTLAELLSLGEFWRESTNVTLFNLTKTFGAMWVVEHLFLLIGVAILGKWVAQYLVSRIQSQLFLIFNLAITIIFLIITTTFTYLLMQNVITESLGNLSVATRVLDYALDSKKAETLAHVETISQNPDVIAAVAAGDHQQLVTFTKDFLADKKQSSLIITNADGQVLLRAEEPDRFSDSLSSDTAIKRAAVGLSASTVSTREGVAAPLVYIRSVSPIRLNETVIGTASVGLVIGDEFVDGVKKATGLDATVYSGNVRSATTFIGSDGKSRLIGIKEENQQVKDMVLKENKEFQGAINILNTPYLAVFMPLTDIDNVPVGMLFAGKPQVATLQTAGRSIELSFVVAVALLLISVIPSYFISRSISRQLER